MATGVECHGDDQGLHTGESMSTKEAEAGWVNLARFEPDHTQTVASNVHYAPRLGMEQR